MVKKKNKKNLKKRKIKTKYYENKILKKLKKN